MLIPHASELSNFKFKSRKKTLDQVIESWVQKEVLPALVEADQASRTKPGPWAYAMVKVPDLYECEGPFRTIIGEFYRKVAELFEPKGYQTSQSHDGAGEYCTVEFKWERHVFAEGDNVVITDTSSLYKGTKGKIVEVRTRKKQTTYMVLLPSPASSPLELPFTPSQLRKA